MKKNTYLLLLFQFLNHVLFAQAPDIQWSKSIGGTEWDEGYTVIQTPDSGYVVAGYRGSFDGDWSECSDYGYMAVVKLDSSGEVLWKKCYGGSTGEYVYSIKNTIDGGLIFTGFTDSNDGDVTGNHGLTDYWVVKTGGSGNLEWQKCYGGTASDLAKSIIQTDDGGYIINGISQSHDGDVSDHHGEPFNPDFWVIKITDLGEIQWQKSLGGSEDDYGQSIIQTQDGGYVCAGFSDSDDGDLTGFHTSSEYWIVKLNSEGTLIWQRTYGGSGSDNPYSVLEDNEGNILVSGVTYSEDGDIIDFHDGANDAWVIKLDNTGNVIWKKCYGGSYGETFPEIIKASSNFIIASGHSTSSDGDLTNNFGSADFWIASIDSSGVIGWQKSMGGSGLDESFAVDKTFDGGYISLGYSTSNDIDVSGNHGGRDIWVVKLVPPCEQQIYYADLDNDSFGDPGSYIYSCIDSAGYVSNNLDCNDLNNLIHPGVSDPCNSIDDNCNGVVDEDAIFLNWYRDADGDGFGLISNDSLSCFDELSGFVFDSTDCNDYNLLINPSQPEICNSIDDNCNLIINEDLIFTIYFQDTDGDNYGNAKIDSLWCSLVTGYVPDSTDCDDTNPDIYPGAEELLNGIDDNCNQFVDEGVEIKYLIADLFNIYPNPATNILFIEYNNTKVATIEIINLMGELIYADEFNAQQIEIDISNFVSGIYFVRLLSVEGGWVEGFVIE